MYNKCQKTWLRVNPIPVSQLYSSSPYPGTPAQFQGMITTYLGGVTVHLLRM